MRVLYIGGAGRSGSTLLEVVLGNAPGWFSVGEIRFFWAYLSGQRERLCGCGHELGRCPFWTRVEQSLKTTGSVADLREIARLTQRFDRTRRVLERALRPPDERRYGELLEATRALYESVADVSGAEVIVDSSKVPTHLELLLDLGWDVRVLHLVRDGRAVAYSWHRKAKQELAMPGTHMERVGLLRALLRWGIENQLVERFASRAAAYRLLRYEDFVKDPAGSLGGALGELGLGPPSIGYLAKPELMVERTHSVGGNPARFRSGPIRIREDREWLVKLGRAKVLALGMLGLPVLQRYGYRL